MDAVRLERWIDSSHRFGELEPFMMVTLQGLGKLDVKLVASDELILEGFKSSKADSIEFANDLTDHVTLSYLWILGAYEFIRTLDERLAGHPFKQHSTPVKHQFERIRMPLAKMEAARRFPGDSPIAYPVLNRDHGAAWQVGPDTFITRRELSDATLTLAESFGG